MIENTKKYVDFHLHSVKSIESGDSISWFSDENTLAKINNCKIAAFAFTDHDYFSSSYYLKIKNLIKENNYNIEFFPGSEISIKTDKKECGHIVFIFDNKLNDEELKRLEIIIRNNSSSYGVNVNKIFNALKDFKYVCIPHVGKSCNNLTYSDLESVIDKIKYVEVIPTDKKYIRKYQKFCEESNKQFIPLLFSDNHDWNNNNQYFAPKVWINQNVEMDFDSIFNNLQTEDEANNE